MIATPLIKRCNTCGNEKDTAEFSFRGNRVGGLARFNSKCRTCQAKWYKRYHADNYERIKKQRKKYRDGNKAHVAKIKKESSKRHRFRNTLRQIAKFSIKKGYAPCIATEEEIRKIYTGYCHACGVSEVDCGKNLALDHDHKTGRARGWLCLGCNLALGYLRNSADRALLLAEYAEKHFQS